MTAHDFRAMATTLLNELGKWLSDAIERALVSMIRKLLVKKAGDAIAKSSSLIMIRRLRRCPAAEFSQCTG